jgi:hypothetical protein
MTQGHRSPAGIVDDPLVELLDNTLTEVRGEHFDGELAEDMLAAIDPAKADAMRAGLLLGELCDRWEPMTGLSLRLAFDALGWDLDADWWKTMDDKESFESSSSLLAALTDLLAKLEARP